jgi:hypothetical protein
MEYNQRFEINLNQISCREHMSQPEETYLMEYRPLAIGLLSREGMHLFEEDITDLYENKLTLKEILAQNMSYVRDINLPNPKKDGKRCATYLDTWMAFEIQPGHAFYDHFFAYYLKHTDLLDVNDFLNYQFEKYHESNFVYFSRFLTLLIRKFQGIIIPLDKATTIQEWVANREKETAQTEELNGSDRYKGKPKIRRRAGDNETILDQRLTVLFIHFMREKHIFLPDKYLTDADAGKAFELLTGYSQHTIRQDLGQYRDLADSKENLRKLKQVLNGVITMIDSHLTGKNPIT